MTTTNFSSRNISRGEIIKPKLAHVKGTEAERENDSFLEPNKESLGLDNCSI